VPHLRKPPRPIAIFCSDIHLSLKAPPARSGEPDWLETQGRYFAHLKRLQGLSPEPHRCPVFHAGDLFDRWNAPADLINFAIAELPRNFHSIAGQHDLPYHNRELIRRSAYWTLVESGTINDLTDYRDPLERFNVTGIQWGELDEGDAPLPPGTPGRRIAVCHAYCWRGDCSFPGAPESASHRARTAQLKGKFDLAFFGDNHRPFRTKSGEFRLINCGGFVRRLSSEANHRPACYLLDSNLNVHPDFLPIEDDVFAAQPGRDSPAREKIEIGDAIGESLDFVTLLKNSLDGLSPEVRGELITILEEAHGV
jgi:hypothetical protein